MKKMTKKEQVLALKTIEARKVKQETMALSKRSQVSACDTSASSCLF